MKLILLGAPGAGKGTQANYIKEKFNIPLGAVIISRTECDRNNLQNIIQSIGNFPVAVRSSGQLEDLADASFAGLYETILDVNSMEELEVAIDKCFNSANSARVVDYLKNKKISFTTTELENKISILIQKMVDVKYAGVAFSISPLSGQEEHILIETCKGSGEKLVSGKVNPTQYIIDNRQFRIVSQTASDELVDLTSMALADLGKNINRIAVYFERPQDIEWAIDQEDRLWILQSRPITSIKWRDDIEEFTNADLKDGGVSARVCTPVMFSLYNIAMANSMRDYFRNLKLLSSKNNPRWMIHRYGRVYWNAGVTKNLLKAVPGFNEKTFDQGLGIQKDYGRQGPHQTPTTLRTILKAIPVVIGLKAEYKNAHTLALQFNKQFEPLNQLYLPKVYHLEKFSEQEFFSDFIKVINDFFHLTEISYFRVIYNNANFQSDFIEFFRKISASLGLAEISIIDLVGGLTDITHIEVQKGIINLYDIARQHGMDSNSFKDALAHFLKDHYHHGDAELEIQTPRWGDDPTSIIKMINNLIHSSIEPHRPEETQKKQLDNFNKVIEQIKLAFARASLMTRLTIKSKFYRDLYKVRSYLSLREKMREYSTRCYFVVRRYLLELGKRLAQKKYLQNPSDIFFLHIEDLIEICSSNKISTALLEKLEYQKMMYYAYSKFEAPNEFGKNVLQVNEDSYMASGEGMMAFSGIGCSPGIVEGTARVLEGLEQIELIQKGDILVTKFTDPGWTPTLGIVAGVVTEVGGVLSHAAVIGREYGIPAVLNIKGITKKIKSGQKIRINGNTGVIHLLS